MRRLIHIATALFFLSASSNLAPAADRQNSSNWSCAEILPQTADQSIPKKRGIRIEPRLIEPKPRRKNAQTTEAAPSVAGPQTFENTVWETVRRSNDPSDFDAYLKMFPTGKFADQAKKSMQRLLRTSPRPATGQAIRKPNRETRETSPQADEKTQNFSRTQRAMIQRSLNAMKYNAGPEDGQFGAKTRAAIQRYQAAMETRVTGFLSIDEASVLVELGRTISRTLPIDTVTSADKFNAPPKPADLDQIKPYAPEQTLPAQPEPRQLRRQPKNPAVASLTKRERAAFDFTKERKNIESAIIEYIINFGSKNCWGDIYFCFLDQILDTNLIRNTKGLTEVVSKYTLISSNTLESTSEKRKFISEFSLLKFGQKYQVINVRTVRVAGSHTEQPAEATE